MKKILAYLLVLVSLMTLFCGTASAEEIYRTGTTGNYYQANVVVTNLTTGKSKEELIGIANWVVTVTCKYEQGNNEICPLAAWASKVAGSVSYAGGNTYRDGEASESTHTYYEGGRRSLLEHSYSCTVAITYAQYASKMDDNTTKDKYNYGSRSTPTTRKISTLIKFRRQH